VFPRGPFGVSLPVSADMISSRFLRLPLDLLLQPRPLKYSSDFNQFIFQPAVCHWAHARAFSRPMQLLKSTRI
jgi:hypothetical protein